METFKQLLRRLDVQIGCCIWLAAGLVAVGIEYDLNKSEWASWVQAVGSIMALAVAIFVMSRQNRNAYRLLIETEERQRQRNSKIVAQMLRRSHFKITKGCELVIAAAGQRSAIEGKLHALKDAAVSEKEMLNSISILELGSVELEVATQKMKDALSNTVEIINMMGPIVARSSDAPEIAEFMNRLIAIANRALAALDASVHNPGV